MLLEALPLIVRMTVFLAVFVTVRRQVCGSRTAALTVKSPAPMTADSPPLRLGSTSAGSDCTWPAASLRSVGSSAYAAEPGQVVLPASRWPEITSNRTT